MARRNGEAHVHISTSIIGDYTIVFIRNRLIRNLVLDTLKFKKHLELQGKN